MGPTSMERGLCAAHNVDAGSCRTRRRSPPIGTIRIRIALPPMAAMTMRRGRVRRWMEVQLFGRGTVRSVERWRFHPGPAIAGDEHETLALAV